MADNPEQTMQPIVDGPENKYHGRSNLQRFNASTYEGLEIFNAYALFGHPSYLILDDAGKIVWKSVDELPAENIERALKAALES